MTLYNENGYAIPDQMDALLDRMSDGAGFRAMYRRLIEEPLLRMTEKRCSPTLYDERGRPIYTSSGFKIGETITVKRPARWGVGTGEEMVNQ